MSERENSQEENVKEFEIDEHSMVEKLINVPEDKVQHRFVPGKLHFNILGTIGNTEENLEEVELALLGNREQKRRFKRNKRDKQGRNSLM